VTGEVAIYHDIDIECLENRAGGVVNNFFIDRRGGQRKITINRIVGSPFSRPARQWNGRLERGFWRRQGSDEEANLERTMKISLLAGVLAFAAGLAPSYGIVFETGTIQFNTHDSNGGGGQLTVWGNNDLGIPAGTPLGAGFTAGLVFSITPITEPADSVGGLLSPGWTLAPNMASFVDGCFTGPDFVLPLYAPGSQIYFEVLAYNGGTYDNSTIRAHSASFTEPLAFGNQAPGYMDNMPLFAVSTPEPRALALAGTGLALLIGHRMRRLKCA
jgi:hypothetical protein